MTITNQGIIYREERIESTPNFFNNKKIVAGAVGLLAVIIIMGGFIFVNNPFAKQSQILGNVETGEVVDKVSKIMVLPTDDVPSVASVVEKTKLADWPFFANAENGDIFIFYPNTGKAILYRPNTNQIVEVMHFPITPEEVNGGSK